jgi:enoyl-CoA hydratase/carnithine racemase
MTLHMSRPLEGVVLLELDHAPANALCMALRHDLAAALAQIAADTTVRSVVLTGRGRAFCAGDDLMEAAARGPSGVEAVLGFGGLMDQVEALRVPVVAAVNGWALGGGLELALACDIRIAAPGAIFTASGVNVGLMASVRRLPRLIGEGAAKAMLLTGSPCDAETALRTGLATAIETDVLGSALAIAERIASRAPLSVEATKRAVAGQGDETEVLTALFHSQDHQQALTDFAAKKTPVFHRR